MLQTTSNAIRQQVMNHEGETILMIHNLIVVHRIPVNGPKEVNLHILGLEIE